MKKLTFRKVIDDLHLWLGLASSIVLFVVCLTGTILAFETEIVQFFDKSDFYSQKEGELVPFSKIVENLEDENTKVKDFIYFGEENRNYVFTTVDKALIEISNGKPIRGKQVVINPYTGNEVIQSSTTKNRMHIIEELHRYLLLNKNIGRPIVGVSTIIFVFLCVSGLVLWFPKKLKQFKKWKFWKQGFTIKRKASWKRINYDLHNTFGFYALFPLLLMGLSGLLWSFTWYYNGLETLLGDKLGKSRFDTTIVISNLKENKPNKARVIDYQSLIYKADSILPYSNLATRVTLPIHTNESVMIRKKSADFLAYNATDKLQFNPYTNQLISKTLFKNEKNGSKIAGLIRGIHVGDFVGLTSKIIYFICCLIATLLPITGIFIWINKNKKFKV